MPNEKSKFRKSLEVFSEETGLSLKKPRERILEFIEGEESIIGSHVAKNISLEGSKLKRVAQDFISELYVLTKDALVSYEVSEGKKECHIRPLKNIESVTLTSREDVWNTILFSPSINFFIFANPTDSESLKSFTRKISNEVLKWSKGKKQK